MPHGVFMRELLLNITRENSSYLLKKYVSCRSCAHARLPAREQLTGILAVPGIDDRFAHPVWSRGCYPAVLSGTGFIIKAAAWDVAY